jgi:hypothetical protein
VPHAPNSAGSSRDLAAELRRIARAAPDARLRGRNRTKADILVYRRPAGDLALKDYSHRSWLMRNTLGRWLLRRESAAYRAAEGVEGLPRCHGRAGPFALALDWIEARPLAEHEREDVPPAVFSRLETIVESLHRRGVALADLHHRDVLVGDGGDVWVVDLATACVLGDRPSALRRSTFRRLCDRDRIGVARLRARFEGRDPDAAMEAIGGAAARRYRRGRRLKQVWNRLRGR